MNKTAIKTFAIWARQKLIDEIIYKAGFIGITETDIASPLPASTATIEFYDIGTGTHAEVSGENVKQRSKLVAKIKEKEKTSDYKTAFNFIVEEVAYTWFNRMIAIRFMEVNEYLPSKMRVLSSEMSGKAEPDMVTTPFETDMEFTPTEKDSIINLKDENKLDELFRMLFIKQCNKLNEVLPELFEKTSDYTELLLTISFTDNAGVLAHLVNDIAEDDFKEAVEIIGWLYQYYNTDPKAEVFANLKKNIKITKENIPAATQLFTPDWIVKYMVENSLGRLRIENHPSENLKANWNYYLDEAEQEPRVQAELDKMRAEQTVKLEGIRVIDPCMGSGHILVYAFDVLMQIYENQGYTAQDAATSIIENNLYGLDIDTRAYQLAYFAIMMKARKYDRRFLFKEIAPQLYCPNGDSDLENYGSLFIVDKLEEKPQIPKEITLFNQIFEKDTNNWNFKRLLHQKYDVVITNPPYMGGSGMNETLVNYIKKEFSDSKSDLFAVFIEKCLQMTKQNAYTAMITMQSWMFLSSFEALRAKIITNDFVNMSHLGARAFEEIGGEVVQTTSFVLRKSNIKNYKATFVRLVDYNSQQAKETAFLEKQDLHIAEQENFSQIPSSPIAYWVSENFHHTFNGEKLSDIMVTREGLSPADNERFLRLWHEIAYFDKINVKWFPYQKGGTMRKWYGNNDFIVNWENNGLEIKSNIDKLTGRVRSHNYNGDFGFKSGITWTAISSASATFRYVPKGFLFDSTGSMGFVSNKDFLQYTLALLNTNYSKEVFTFISPTIKFMPGHIIQIPYRFSAEHKPQIDQLVEQNISLSKTDWDAFEISWDFVRHPFLYTYAMNPKTNEVLVVNSRKNLRDLEYQFYMWNQLCENNFNQLKANEEELNRIFIDIYDLADELSPEVAEKDVTLKTNTAYRYKQKKKKVKDSEFEQEEEIVEAKEIRDKKFLHDTICELISYAVGCIFGRYSLDTDGLAYVGGDFDNSKYTSFIPDDDNCIPITDEEYFTDDIVGRFVEFVKVVYSAKTLEDNLYFIANALGNKGNTAREIIRNYFVKDFYKDHVKTYQKRPIYWLYDSGKQDGFKALVYMHRYDADTTGLVRVDYLHKIQRTYISEIDRMKDMVANSKDSRDVALAEKRKEKLIKQLKETKDYDEKIAHLALSRITIDLDDGVKVNYEKVQTGHDGMKLEILGTVWEVKK